MTAFSEKVNAASRAIAVITQDPAERYGIAQTLVKIYEFELQRSFVTIDKEGKATPNENA